MKMGILLLTLFSWSTWAQVSTDCVPLTVPTVDIKDIQKLLDWHGANAEQIEKAACKTINPPSAKELDDFIQSKATGSTSAQINGVSFENESPALIEAFTNFTTAKDGFGIFPEPDLQKNFQEDYKINPECQKVRCAMEKIWGKGLSEKILYLNLKHHFNSSEFAFQNSDRFTEAEINDVLMGVEDLPPHLIPLGKDNQRLTHFKRGFSIKAYGSNVVANAVVMLFDNWDTEPSREKQYTIFHEASHNVSSKLGKLDESPEWLAQSSWVKTGDNWAADPNACQITEYGATNPWEDFAESLSTYRYNAQAFKTKCPKKYDFIKTNVAKGIEYIEVKDCTPITEDQLKLAQKNLLQKISESLHDQTFSAQEVSKACVDSFSYPPLAEEMRKCSVKLMTSGQTNSSERIADALLLAQIPDIQANRDQVLASLEELIANDEALKLKMIEKAKGILEAIDSIVQESIRVAIPKEMANKPLDSDSYVWRIYQEPCRAQVLQSISKDELAHCYLKTIINKDKDSQRWDIGYFSAYKAPPLFKADALKSLESKREAALEDHLMKQETTKAAMKKVEAEIKENLLWHNHHVSVLLNEMKDWKNKTPEEFCSLTYAKSSTMLTYFGMKEGTPVPSIQDWCVKKQSERNRRSKFSDEEWKEYSENILK